MKNERLHTKHPSTSTLEEQHNATNGATAEIIMDGLCKMRMDTAAGVSFKAKH